MPTTKRRKTTKESRAERHTAALELAETEEGLIFNESHHLSEEEPETGFSVITEDGHGILVEESEPPPHETTIHLEEVSILSVDPLPAVPCTDTTTGPPLNESEQPVKKPTQTASVLSEFVEKEDLLLSLILEHEADERIGKPCSCAAAPATVGCCDCIDYAPTCPDCFIKNHKTVPFHWAEVWDSDLGYFVRQDISLLKNDHALNIGHRNTQTVTECTGPKVLFTLVHTNGIHGTKVQFCNCVLGREERLEMLMRAGIFPGTISQPTTGFTFSVLKQYHLLHLESNIPAYDFCESLRRLTDNAFTPEAQDEYKQFLRVSRVWRSLTTRKRLGQAHNLQKQFPHRPPGNLTVYCPACPEPDFNLDGAWEQTDSTLKQAILLLQLTLDGNYHATKAFKNSDPDDISLLGGHAHFPLDSDLKSYLTGVLVSKSASLDEIQNITCRHLQTHRNQDQKKFKNSEVSGIVNCQCSHVFVHSSVDLQLGERHANLDLALARALQQRLHNRPEGYQPALQLACSFDNMCELCTHLHERFEDLQPDLAHLVTDDFASFLVPLLHVTGHDDDCTYLYSVAYRENGGHFHGETAEQYWAELNQLGPQTRQMNAGHRHDVLSDHHNDWGWKKTMKMTQTLFDELEHARKQVISKREDLAALTVLQDPSVIAEWRERDHKPVRGTKPVQSVYRHSRDIIIPSQAKMYQALLEQEATKKSIPKLIAKAMSSEEATFINEGIHLENLQHQIKFSLKYSATDEEVQKLRKGLATRLKPWRRSQSRLMSVAAAYMGLYEGCDPENEPLFLPSAFAYDKLPSLELSDLAAKESKLREGAAYDGIEHVQMMAKTLSNYYDYKKANITGTAQLTRAGEKIQTLRRKRDMAISGYNRAREAMIKLGLITKESSKFPEMTVADTYRPPTVNKRQLGDSRNKLTWTQGAIGTKRQNVSGSVAITNADNPHISQVGTQVTRRKELPPRPKKRKNLDSDGLIGDDEEEKHNSDKTPAGWIWDLSTKGILRDDEVKKFSRDSDRVQWFRAEAEAERWLEQWEVKQAEFLRVIMAFTAMATRWAAAADEATTIGHKAYAKQKAMMFRRMAWDTENTFTKLGYADRVESIQKGAERAFHELIREDRKDIDAALSRYSPKEQDN